MGWSPGGSGTVKPRSHNELSISPSPDHFVSSADLAESLQTATHENFTRCGKQSLRDQDLRALCGSPDDS